jgi:hypothetical protein
MRSVVPSSFLPRIFQDTFQIARGLGCRCIWVDALCIIQDSDSDKASEIAKMKDVFQNSYLQELLLPCCILHYTSDQLVWECQTIRSWESGNFVESVDDSLPEVGDDIRLAKNINLKPMIRIMKELEVVWGPDALYRYWYRVLAVYSCRELSYDSDKISGISWIADLIGQYVQDRLVHGL